MNTLHKTFSHFCVWGGAHKKWVWVQTVVKRTAGRRSSQWMGVAPRCPSGPPGGAHGTETLVVCYERWLSLARGAPHCRPLVWWIILGETCRQPSRGYPLPHRKTPSGGWLHTCLFSSFPHYWPAENLNTLCVAVACCHSLCSQTTFVTQNDSKMLLH